MSCAGARRSWSTRWRVSRSRRRKSPGSDKAAASTRTLASMTDRDVAELQTTMRPSAHRRGRFSLACRPNPATHEAVGYAMTDHL